MPDPSRGVASRYGAPVTFSCMSLPLDLFADRPPHRSLQQLDRPLHHRPSDIDASTCRQAATESSSVDIKAGTVVVADTRYSIYELR